MAHMEDRDDDDDDDVAVVEQQLKQSRKSIERAERRSKKKLQNLGLDENGEPSTNNVSFEEKNDNDDDEAVEQQLKQSRKYLERAERRAKKKLQKLGLDENGEPIDNFSIAKYPVREWKFTLPGFRETIALNPVVMFLALFTVCGVALWSTIDPDGSYNRLYALRRQVSLNFTWFLQGSKAIESFFLMYITYKFGHLRIGRNDDKPEFSNWAYFCMIFAAGVGPSLLVYGIVEPLYHQSDNFFVQTGYRSQDEVDMFAINLAMSSWGILCWLQYTLVAICVGLASHRFGLPRTYRACFYPILGTYTWGWIGDCIDALTMVVTIAGGCIYLALVSVQITKGLIYMRWIDDKATADEITSIQKIIMWLVTVVSIAAMISKLHGATRVLSTAAVSLGCVLTFLVFVQDDTKYLLNLQVQEVGYFLQMNIFQFNFWTDAFGQLREGSGRAVDGKSGADWWMDVWIVCYLSWTVIVAAGVGMFVGWISRGRRLWEVVVYCFAAPMGYTLMWFCIWSGTGIRQQRVGMELEILGSQYYNNSGHFLVDGSELCYNVPQGVVIDDGGNTIFTNPLPGISPVCMFDGDNTVHNVLHSFRLSETIGGGMWGQILSSMYLVAIAVYYLAYSNSVLLMVDSLASNGRKNYHWMRRMVWAFITCTVTTALMSQDANAMGALQSASYAVGLPMAVLMSYLVQSAWLLCTTAERLPDDADYKFPVQPEFVMPVYGGIFNSIEYIVSWGNINATRQGLGIHRPTSVHMTEFAKGLFIPLLPLHQVLACVYPQSLRSNIAVVTTYSMCYYGWVVLFLLSWSYPSLGNLAWAMMTICGVILALIRSGFREQYNLRSNTLADVMASTLLWPQVLTQMQLHVQYESEKEDKHKEKDAAAEAVAGGDSKFGA